MLSVSPSSASPATASHIVGITGLADGDLEDRPGSKGKGALHPRSQSAVSAALSSTNLEEIRGRSLKLR